MRKLQNQRGQLHNSVL